MRLQSAAITALLSLVLVGCQATAEGPSPPWPKNATLKEKAAALTKYLDSHVGTSFPDLTLTNVMTGQTRTLYSLRTDGRLLVLNYSGGCPFAEADIAYFKSVQWQVPDADQVVVVIDERLARRGLVPDTGDYQHVYKTHYPLPGWMSRVAATPQTYIVDASTKRVVRWIYHLDDAKKFFPNLPAKGGESS